MSALSTAPKPTGELTLQTIAMPKDTNPAGDIFGGWLMSQMDLAGGVITSRIAKGRTVTVSANRITFLRPVPVGAIVSCYCEIVEIGHSSIRVATEVWINSPDNKAFKATEGEFVFVAIDDQRKTRAVNPDEV
ncbi:MAG: acyl-CoA thioesterase [bacterium]